MNEEERNGKLHYVDDLEYRLNKTKVEPKEIHIHKVKDIESSYIKNSWPDEIEHNNYEKEKNSFGVKFLIFSMAIFVCAMLYVGYLVLSSKNFASNNNINLTTDIKPYVDGGEINKINIDVENKNKTALKGAVLSISYNRGVSSESETSKISEKKEIGDLTEGSVSKQSFDVQFYGKAGEVKNLIVNLEYHLDGTNGSFSKQLEVTTVINKSPIEIEIKGPKTVNSGQIVNYDFVIKNNLQNIADSFVVKVSMPQSFKVEGTSDSTLFFNVDKLDVGGSITKSVSGYFEGLSGEKSSIHVDAGMPTDSNSKNISVVYFSNLTDVEIKESELKLNLNSVTERGKVDVLRFGDRLTFLINYENISNQALNDVEIVAKIKGDAPLISGVSVLDDGYFDSTNRTITWNGATRNELKNIPPGGNGLFRFEVPIIDKGENTPKLNVEINGKALNLSKTEIVTNINKEYLVQGSATLSAWTSYKNSSFKNTGPVPPQVDTETTYTLHLSAFAQNNLDDSQISFTLPIYTNWSNTVSQGNNISYNKNNRTVLWDIGHINAGSTVSSDVMVSVKPSLSHLGRSPDITGGIVFTGTETDSKARISVSVKPLTTNIGNEDWGTNINTGNVINK